MAIKPKFVSADRVDAITKAISLLTTKRCLVGIPGDPPRTPEPGEPAPPTNAVIGFEMEYGNPSKGIPARPFLLPGIANARDAIVAQLERGIKRAVAVTNPVEAVTVADNALAAVGMVAKNAVVQKITDGPFVPLALATIQQRARRGRKGAIRELRIRQGLRLSDNDATRLAMGLKLTIENVRPLIDTGQLRRAVTFIVTDK